MGLISSRMFYCSHNVLIYCNQSGKKRIVGLDHSLG